MSKEDYIKVLEKYRDGKISVDEFVLYDMPEDVQQIFDVSEYSAKETANVAIDVLKGNLLLKSSYIGRIGIDSTYVLYGHAEDLEVYLKRVHES